MDVAAELQSRIDAGTTLVEAARLALTFTGGAPIAAIKALRQAASIDLGEAKGLVHSQLSDEARASAERMWDAAEASLDG